MASNLFKNAKSLFGREEPEPAAAEPPKPVQRFHAVSIVTGARACDAAKQLADKRFLSRDAPPLPLKNCGSSQCECRYVHHGDRRKGGRRVHDLGVALDGYFDGAEQRDKSKRGRRKTDGKQGK